MSADKDFGLLISFVLPGFIALLGLAYHYPELEYWLGMTEHETPTIGGFLFLTVASIYVGLIISTVRWLLIDKAHHLTGLQLPPWDFRQLASREQGFAVLISIHYRYYQFYANSTIATIIFFAARWTAVGFSWLEALVGSLLIALLLAGSRDTLRKYYHRVAALLSTAG